MGDIHFEAFLAKKIQAEIVRAVRRRLLPSARRILSVATA
jgi:hypothetical protein